MDGPAPQLIKYPSTRHVETSGLQRGDNPSRVPFADLKGRTLAVETKIDGSNVGVSFTPGGELRLQSRGTWLEGSDKHHFDQFKLWASVHQGQLRDLLGDNLVMYGEWMAAKHSVYYDRLPHLFMEFDILDRASGRYLDTAARHRLLAGSCVVSVPVRCYGQVASLTELLGEARDGQLALYKSAGWRDRLEEAALAAGYEREHPTRPDLTDMWRETDSSDSDEGLYIKAEEGGEVTGRYKWVRPGFVQTITDSGSHWDSRAHLPNEMTGGMDVLWDADARSHLADAARGLGLA